MPLRTNEEFTKENDYLRGLIARSDVPCVYCGLSEMAKCASGFPGCARADDIMAGDDAFMRSMVERLNNARALLYDCRDAFTNIQVTMDITVRLGPFLDEGKFIPKKPDQRNTEAPAPDVGNGSRWEDPPF